MLLRYLLGSFSPNKYHELRELPLARVLKLTVITAVLSVLIFMLLALPALFRADDAIAELSKTTDVQINGSLQQTVPTYVMRNPDIIVTTGTEEGFITVTPQGLTIKRFIYFGDKTYSWHTFSSLDTLPASSIAVRLAIFLLPSILLWGSLVVLATALVAALLYSFIAYFILHARNFHIGYTDLVKVTVYASLPSMLVFAAIPILRLGLPVAIVLGFCFVLWLVLSLLGTALFAERHVEHPIKIKKHP